MTEGSYSSDILLTESIASRDPTSLQATSHDNTWFNPIYNTWNYIRCFVWTTISGIVGCLSIHEQQHSLADDRHSSWSSNQSQADQQCGDTLINQSDSGSSSSSSSDYYSVEAFHTPGVKQKRITTHSDSELILSETNSPRNKCNQLVIRKNNLHILPYYRSLSSSGLAVSANSKSPDSVSPGTKYLFRHPVSTNNSSCSQSHAYVRSENSTLDNDSSPEIFLPITLLSSYQGDLSSGKIDHQTYDTVVTNLLQAALPRNLSDSGGIASISPSIRKMYAWTKSPPIDTADLNLDDVETSVGKPSVLFGDRTSSIDSNDSLDQERQSGARAYPGSGTWEDSSTTSTIDSTSTFTCTEENHSSITLDPLSYSNDLMPSSPHVHSSNGNSSTALDNAMASLNLDDKILPTSTSPDRHARRPSRDKSPVTTVNSLMPSVNTEVVPTFAAFEGQALLGSTKDDLLSPPGEEPPKPRRSSSLKSTRDQESTSLKSPGTQKAVRFADALGLELASTRQIFDSTKPPKIPASATSDLDLDSDESIAKLGAKQFTLCFAIPGSATNFIRRVMGDMVSLEDAYVEMPRGVLTGTIRVRSLTFEKHVFIRITYNNWATFFDTMAAHIHGSFDGATDRFSFSLVFPDTMTPGNRAQFAIRYQTQTGEQFWDNNHGQNYAVVCYAKATDMAGDGSWMHYL